MMKRKKSFIKIVPYYTYSMFCFSLVACGQKEDVTYYQKN